jgi:hypothetical protein
MSETTHEPDWVRGRRDAFAAARALRDWDANEEKAAVARRNAVTEVAGTIRSLESRLGLVSWYVPPETYPAQEKEAYRQRLRKAVNPLSIWGPKDREFHVWLLNEISLLREQPDQEGKSDEELALLAGPPAETPLSADPRHYAGWLDTGLADVEGLQPWLRPFSADAMEAFPVSALVNNARHEGPDCAQPLTPA